MICLILMTSPTPIWTLRAHLVLHLILHLFHRNQPQNGGNSRTLHRLRKRSRLRRRFCQSLLFPPNQPQHRQHQQHRRLRNPKVVRKTGVRPFFRSTQRQRDVCLVSPKRGRCGMRNTGSPHPSPRGKGKACRGRIRRTSLTSSNWTGRCHGRAALICHHRKMMNLRLQRPLREIMNRDATFRDGIATSRIFRAFLTKRRQRVVERSLTAVATVLRMIFRSPKELQHIGNL